MLKAREQWATSDLPLTVLGRTLFEDEAARAGRDLLTKYRPIEPQSKI